MSIKPPSDLLLDVARAADPAKSSAATQRLARIAADGLPEDEDFTEVLDGVATPTAAAPPQQASLSALTADNVAAPTDAEAQAYRGIAALLLQNLVENILPDSEEFFGAEAGASVWKSMLAEELGTDLSKRVDLGIGPKHVGREMRAHHHAELNTSLALVGQVAAKHS
jgi:hypothetical protein